MQVIAETRRPGASVAEVARRHDLNTNVVFHWLRDPRYNAKSGAPAFLPIEARPERLLEAPDPVERIDLVIELGEDARIRCSDEASLIVAIRALRKVA